MIRRINLILRGWVTYFDIGDSSRCFGCVWDWVEKQIRRHLMRARKRKGFGWKRQSRRWLYNRLGLFGRDRVHRPPAATAESTPSLIGPISLVMKRSAGNPHAAYDVAGAGNRIKVRSEAPASCESRRQQLIPMPKVTAPALDPTQRGVWRNRASGTALCAYPLEYYPKIHKAGARLSQKERLTRTRLKATKPKSP